jgi:hypothetical protein
MEDAMNTNKTFAFKLASQKRVEGKWKARDGLAVAGCTDPTGDFNYRYSTIRSYDGGVYC